MELVIDDAKIYLENTSKKFDIMFFDLSDPVEGGPAKLLYTQSFYQMCGRNFPSECPILFQLQD